MTFDIPTEYESVLNHLVATGAFPSKESALAHALQLLTEEHDAALTSNQPHSTAAMPKQIRIDELVDQQKVLPFDADAPLPIDIWPDDQKIDEFLAFIDESRNELPKLGTDR